MIFKIVLEKIDGWEMPLNYAYPMSAAIYRILSRGDAKYAEFLHEHGYGKGLKLFTFSEMRVPFEVGGNRKDRMILKANEAMFMVCFHLPEAMENFVKGLFKSEEIVIADKKSKAVFNVKSIESLPNPFVSYGEREIIEVSLKPLSPVVVGEKKEDGKYLYLDPSDSRFAENIRYNWRSKIAASYGDVEAGEAVLGVEITSINKPFKSRLIAIKANTEKETRVRGWMQMGIKLLAERKYIELLLNAGVGLYNAQGMGCVGVVEEKVNQQE